MATQLAVRGRTTRRLRLRHGLGALLGFAALNAFAGGYYGMAGAEGVPLEWLDGTPFSSYFLPSLILFVVVGGSLLVATIAVFARARRSAAIAAAAGLVLLGWLAVETALIGYVSWMQPATGAGALLIFLLAALMRRRDRTEFIRSKEASLTIAGFGEIERAPAAIFKTGPWRCDPQRRSQ